MSSKKQSGESGERSDTDAPVSYTRRRSLDPATSYAHTLNCDDQGRMRQEAHYQGWNSFDHVDPVGHEDPDQKYPDISDYDLLRPHLGSGD